MNYEELVALTKLNEDEPICYSHSDFYESMDPQTLLDIDITDKFIRLPHPLFDFQELYSNKGPEDKPFWEYQIFYNTTQEVYYLRKYLVKLYPDKQFPEGVPVALALHEYLLYSPTKDYHDPFTITTLTEFM